MTCSDHLCHTEDVHEWTTFDYILLPPSLIDSFSFTGSIFQQLINSRHLPLSFHLRANYLSPQSSVAVPKKKNGEMSQFFESIEHDFLAKSGNSTTFEAFPVSDRLGL